MGEEELVCLRVNYEIPNDVVLSVARTSDDGDMPTRPPVGYIALLIDYFKARLLLSIFSPIKGLLVAMNVASFQLHPNIYS